MHRKTTVWLTYDSLPIRPWSLPRIESSCSSSMGETSRSFLKTNGGLPETVLFSCNGGPGGVLEKFGIVTELPAWYEYLDVFSSCEGYERSLSDPGGLT